MRRFGVEAPDTVPEGLGSDSRAKLSSGINDDSFALDGLRPKAVAEVSKGLASGDNDMPD